MCTKLRCSGEPGVCTCTCAAMPWMIMVEACHERDCHSSYQFRAFSARCKQCTSSWMRSHVFSMATSRFINGSLVECDHEVVLLSKTHPPRGLHWLLSGKT